jgi:hypothetical protein
MSPKKVELEEKLEQRCVDKVEAAGGLALKLSIPGVRGFPDRTILAPGRLRSNAANRTDWQNSYERPRVWFAEFKRLKSGRVSAQQHRWRMILHGLGFGVYFCDTDEQFDAAWKRETER